MRKAWHLQYHTDDSSWPKSCIFGFKHLQEPKFKSKLKSLPDPTPVSLLLASSQYSLCCYDSKKSPAIFSNYMWLGSSETFITRWLIPSHPTPCFSPVPRRPRGISVRPSRDQSDWRTKPANKLANDHRVYAKGKMFAQWLPPQSKSSIKVTYGTSFS